MHKRLKLLVQKTGNHQRVRVRKNFQSSKQVTSFATNTNTFEIQVCVLCKPERHLLFSYNKFKELPHDKKLPVLKTHKLCHNCLGAGHYARQCKSIHHCWKCHGQHYYIMNKLLTPAQGKHSYVRSPLMQP